MLAIQRKLTVLSIRRRFRKVELDGALLVRLRLREEQFGGALQGLVVGLPDVRESALVRVLAGVSLLVDPYQIKGVRDPVDPLVYRSHVVE